jgi:hypothetical protein
MFELRLGAERAARGPRSPLSAACRNRGPDGRRTQLIVNRMTSQPTAAAPTRAGTKPASPKVVGDMPDREAQPERDHAVDDVSNPQHGEAPMVTTTTANLYVSEPCLNKQERDTLKHFLGLLLDADEPEAMLACLRRLAERKAHDAVRGARVNRQAAERWLRLAEALVTVEHQVIASKD